jgi:hypothetical protein
VSGYDTQKRHRADDVLSFFKFIENGEHWHGHATPPQFPQHVGPGVGRLSARCPTQGACPHPFGASAPLGPARCPGRLNGPQPRGSDPPSVDAARNPVPNHIWVPRFVRYFPRPLRRQFDQDQGVQTFVVHGTSAPTSTSSCPLLTSSSFDASQFRHPAKCFIFRFEHAELPLSH